MAGDGITYVGHATVLLELGGARLLTDPVLRSGFGHVRRRVPAVDRSALGDLDAVLISHLHHDHLDVRSLRMLGARGPVVVPRGAGAFVARASGAEVVELEAGGTLRLGDVTITATRADHRGGRFGRRLRADPLGYVAGGPRRVYFAGDTGLFAGMADLARPPLDVALVPVWGWGPSLGAGHLDPASAARALTLLRPRIAVPIHWGTFYPVGLDRVRGAPLTDPPRRFARLAAEHAPEVEVRVLAPGERLDLLS
jgi:L-ascorbate metabolism protein UlaG (beta-lactamase superfamily)